MAEFGNGLVALLAGVFGGGIGFLMIGVVFLFLLLPYMLMYRRSRHEADQDVPSQFDQSY